jgi:hypothetical protein
MVHTFSLMDYDVFIIAIIILTYSYCVSMLYGCGNSLWISSSWILWMIHVYYACYGYYGRHGYCLTFIDMDICVFAILCRPKKPGSFKFRCSSVERCSPAAWQDVARPWGRGCYDLFWHGKTSSPSPKISQSPNSAPLPQLQRTLNAWEATTSPYTCSSEHGNCSTEKFYVDFCQ